MNPATTKISSDNQWEIIYIIPSDKDAIKNFFKKEQFKNFKTSFKSLNKQQREIIYHYYFKRLCMKKYALKHNLTYNQCRYLQTTALKHLKENICSN